MIKGYFNILVRNILSHKLVSIITIVGLSAGLAGTMFIFLWVMDELNFDHFHKNKNRLYRVEQDQPYSAGVYPERIPHATQHRDIYCSFDA